MKRRISFDGIVLPHDDGRRSMDPSRCFYCNQSIGQPHRLDCVCLNKKVKIRATFEYEIEIPYSWTKEDLEEYRNLGSYCADNALEELNMISRENGCICHIAKFEMIEVVDPRAYSKEMSEDELKANPELI